MKHGQRYGLFRHARISAGPWPYEDTAELTAAPSAVSLARRHTREMLSEWKLDFLADDAEPT
jgi:hypothetical protein